MSGTYRGRSSARGGYVGTRGQRGYSGGGARQPARQPSGGGRRPGIGMILAIGAVAVTLVVGAIFLIQGFSPASANPSKTASPDAALLSSDKFYEGVSVDGVALGGLTKDEAKQQIQAKQQALAQSTGVTVVDPTGAKTPLLLSDLPAGAYSFDTDAVLADAWNKGRDEATDDEKLAFIQQLPANPVNLTTKVTVTDVSSLEQKVRELTKPFFTAAVDAAFVPGQFDTTKTGIDRLTFTPDKAGSQVNPDTLWTAVQAAFTGGTFGEVQMTVEPVAPHVTLADVQADLQLQHVDTIQLSKAKNAAKVNAANVGHTYTTLIHDSSTGRLKNIELAGNAVSGIVMPGDEFDFNKLTGNRTVDQGYMLATVDIGGTADKGLGGGVCQVSGTMYNAVIRYGGKYEGDDTTPGRTKDQPGLAVTARDSHSLPSAYLLTGTDATVDVSTGKNLKFRNDFDKPVLVIMYYDKVNGEYFEHCDIYGPNIMENGSPVKFDLVRTNFVTFKALKDAAPRIVYSKYAEPGHPVLKNDGGSRGYKVDVYVTKTVNGVTTQLPDMLYSDKYNPQSSYWYVYPGDTLPTPTPIPITTPAPPDPTPSPTDGST